MKLDGFLQVREGFLFGLALAGDVEFEALRDIPVSFAPDGGRKRPVHDHTLSRDGQGDLLNRFPKRPHPLNQNGLGKLPRPTKQKRPKILIPIPVRSRRSRLHPILQPPKIFD